MTFKSNSRQGFLRKDFYAKDHCSSIAKYLMSCLYVVPATQQCECLQHQKNGQNNLWPCNFSLKILTHDSATCCRRSCCGACPSILSCSSSRAKIYQVWHLLPRVKSPPGCLSVACHKQSQIHVIVSSSNEGSRLIKPGGTKIPKSSHSQWISVHLYSSHYWLVASSPLRNLSQIGSSSPTYGKIKSSHWPSVKHVKQTQLLNIAIYSGFSHGRCDLS